MAYVKPVGGVRSVELFRPCLVEAAWSGREAAIAPAQGASATAVPITEDKSLYTEHLRQEHGLRSVVHELRIEAGEADAAPWFDREFLRRAAAEGVVARVEMLSGEVLWAGISRRFGTAQPLYLTAVESSSALSPRQRPTVSVTLRGEDCDFAYRQID